MATSLRSHFASTSTLISGILSVVFIVTDTREVYEALKTAATG
jgi:hypothetical protein